MQHDTRATPTLPIATGYVESLVASLPVRDQIELNSLSPSKMPAWALAHVNEYKTRIQELECHIATLRSIHNTGAPIHVLPPEILMKIFVHGFDKRHDLRMLHVCRQWRAIILDTPHFWAKALASRDLRYDHRVERTFVTFALARSGAVPLELLIRHHFLGAWRVLAAHFERMSSLTIILEKAQELSAFQRTVSSTAMHILRHLNISISRNLKRTPKLVFDVASVPRLRELWIDGCLVTEESTIPSLEKLTVCGEVLNSNDLWRFLRRCSRLRSLSLVGATGGRVSSSDLELRQVSLPHLLHLSVSQEGNCTRKILSQLVQYPTTMVEVSTSTRSIPAGGFIPPHFPALHVAPPVDRLYVSYLDNFSKIYIGCYSGHKARVRTEGSFRHIDTATAQQYLDPFFTLGDIRELIIYNLIGGASDAWTALYPFMRGISRLEILHLTDINIRCAFVKRFLQLDEMSNSRSQDSDPTTSGAEHNGLTLAWVLAIRMDDRGPSSTAKELEALVCSLTEGERRLNRLELYGAPLFSFISGRLTPSAPMQCVAELPHTDVELTRTIVAPFMPKLLELADVVVVG